MQLTFSLTKSNTIILFLLATMWLSNLSGSSYNNSGLNHLISDPIGTQKPSIIGSIKSKQGEPIIGAHVSIESTMIGTSTDLDGMFKVFNLKEGEYSLKISALGYKTVYKTIQMKQDVQYLLELVFEEDELLFPEILILGKSDRMFSKIPGSASYINSKELAQINPISGNEVFRRIPGIHISDEEGIGMRANIGIRGLDPDRSRTLLVLEDGIPVALAPYGEPEMYYTPPIDRMSGLEVLKGSGQILYGPQTIGGVVNFLTSNPPSESTGKIRLQAGQGGYINGLFSYGNTYDKTGFQVTLLKKRADKLGLTTFDINDLNAKFQLSINANSSISLKAGIYSENSNSTYIGLTQTMFDSGDQDFVHMAPDDNLGVKRYSISGHHEYKINQKTKLKTTAFGYTTSRDWRRQDFSSNNATNTKPSNWTGVTWGDENIVGGAIYMRNSTGNRNRQFEVAGLESRVEHDYTFVGLENSLKLGVRYLYEKANEQRVNGTKYNVSSGALVEAETRTGNAISLYLQNQTKVNTKLELNYGLRLENFSYERDIARRTFTINGQNVLRDTSLINASEITQLIPGIGFTWKIASKTSIFSGVHKGFAPPRTKDAISEIGEVYDLKAEQSINAELGLRSAIGKGLDLEVTGFYMDFSNQIIPVSESSGGTGVGLVNGGQTIHRGIEAAIKLNISDYFPLQKTSLLFDVNATYTDAFFSGNRLKDGINLSGNKTPYAPSYLLNSTFTFQHVSGFSFRVTGNYVGEQFVDELNTINATPDGRNGKIDAYHSFDTNLSYEAKKLSTTFSIAIKNFTDERFIVNRRSQGIRVGLSRFVSFSIEHKF